MDVRREIRGESRDVLTLSPFPPRPAPPCAARWVQTHPRLTFVSCQAALKAASPLKPLRPPGLYHDHSSTKRGEATSHSHRDGCYSDSSDAPAGPRQQQQHTRARKLHGSMMHVEERSGGEGGGRRRSGGVNGFYSRGRSSYHGSSDEGGGGGAEGGAGAETGRGVWDNRKGTAPSSARSSPAAGGERGGGGGAATVPTLSLSGFEGTCEPGGDGGETSSNDHDDDDDSSEGDGSPQRTVMMGVAPDAWGAAKGRKLDVNKGDDLDDDEAGAPAATVSLKTYFVLRTE